MIPPLDRTTICAALRRSRSKSRVAQIAYNTDLGSDEVEQRYQLRRKTADRSDRISERRRRRIELHADGGGRGTAAVLKDSCAEIVSAYRRTSRVGR